MKKSFLGAFACAGSMMAVVYAFCGSCKPNDCGFCDKHGNVYDWRFDWCQEDIIWNAIGVPNANGANALMIRHVFRKSSRDAERTLEMNS